MLKVDLPSQQLQQIMLQYSQPANKFLVSFSGSPATYNNYCVLSSIS